jgi:beta-phosphoglucomutase-like phosphatase (HAD superfamily)
VSLTSRQLAKLRELGRQSNELELRHEARRAAFHTQRDYLAALKRKLETLPRSLAAAHSEATSVQEHDALDARQRQTERSLREEILAAQGELEQLQAQLSLITNISGPLRELVDQVLRRANLTRQAAGIAFGDDRPGSRETVTLGAR